MSVDWEGKTMTALLDLKADLLNLPQYRRRNRIVAFFFGENEPDIEAMFDRFHTKVNRALLACAEKDEKGIKLFNGPSIGVITAEEIKKQLKEK